MGSTISRNPAFGRWYGGRPVERTTEGGADDWTYRWIGLKVLAIEDLLTGYAASAEFGRLIPADRIGSVLRVAEEDARRLGEILAGSKGVDRATLLAVAASWSQLLHDEDKLRYVAQLHVNGLGVLAPADIVLAFVRVLDAMMKLRGAKDAVHRPAIEAIASSIVRKIRQDGRLLKKAPAFITVEEFVTWGMHDATVKPLLGSLRDTPDSKPGDLQVVPHQFTLPGEREPARVPFPVDSVVPEAFSQEAPSPTTERGRKAAFEGDSKPPTAGEEGLVAVQVLVDCGLIDADFAAEVYGANAPYVQVTKTEYLRDLCPQDAEVQAFCSDAFDQLGPVPPPPPPPPPEKTQIEFLEEKVHERMEELEETDNRLEVARMRKQRAVEHRDREEQAAILMQMKLTAVRMELRELKRRMPPRATSTAGSVERRFRSTKVHEPIAANFAGVESVADMERRRTGAKRGNKSPDRKTHSRSEGNLFPMMKPAAKDNIFDDFAKEGAMNADQKFLTNRYMQDHAVDSWKKQASFEKYIFREWLDAQSGEAMTELTTYYTSYAHAVRQRTLRAAGREVIGGGTSPL